VLIRPSHSQAKGKLPTDCSREDLAAYLDQIETAIDELEAVYNRLRVARTEPAPFSELKRQRQGVANELPAINPKSQSPPFTGPAQGD
jgi:hypothetical protein